MEKSTLSGLSIILFLFMLSACRTHTYSFGIKYYPENADPKDAQYCLHVNIDGAKGKAYNDMTKKDIWISITGENNTILLKREYSVQARDLTWEISWPNYDDLTISFYEQDGIISLTETNELNYIPTEIFSVSFTLDSKLENFIETAVPDYVILSIRRELERAMKQHTAHLYLRIDKHDAEPVLNILQETAKKFSLSQKEVPPNCVNCLASFTASDFIMSVTQTNDKEKGNWIISLKGWDRKELSKSIVASLKKSLTITYFKKFD